MSRATSRFISSDEIGSVADWDFPVVGSSSQRFAGKLKAQAVAEEQLRDDVIRQAGYSEGYSQGYAQGHTQASLEGQQQLDEYIETQGKAAATQFASLFESVQNQLAESEQVMAKGVLELACELARQVVRHELASNPNALQPVVREALGLLAADSKAALVRMHPQDLDVLADVLREEHPNLALTLVSDSSITPGGCTVESAGTVIDGSLEKRWARAVAKLGLDSAWGGDDGGA